jgi:phage recombination protein Bet
MQGEAMSVDEARGTAIKWLESTGNLQKFSESEKNLFLDMCCALKLNPFRREIYGVKYKDSFNIIIGYEVYLKKAEGIKGADGERLLSGWTVDFGKDGNEFTCTCTIHRRDWAEPFTLTVWQSEYDQGNTMWKTKPRTMLRKVAIAQAFRLCFPEELGGMPYTEDEIQPGGMPYEERNVTPASAEKRLPVSPSKAEVLKLVVESVDGLGAPLFSETEKESFRTMVREQGLSKTLVAAEGLKEKKLEEISEQ